MGVIAVEDTHNNRVDIILGIHGMDPVKRLTARYGPSSRRAGIRESPCRTLTARAGRLPIEPRESEHGHPPRPGVCESRRAGTAARQRRRRH